MSDWNNALDAAIACLPGGTQCDPQWLADMLRGMKRDDSPRATDLDRIAAYITRSSHQLYIDEDEGQWQASTGWSVVGFGRTLQEALHNLAVMLPEAER